MKKMLQLSSVFIFTAVFVVFFSSNTFAQNMEVSGAGASVVNGIYLLDGTLNGANKYTQDVPPNQTQHYIYYSSTDRAWYIAVVESDYKYYKASQLFPTATPPSTGWSPVGKAPGPAPTVQNTPLPVELSSFSAHLDGQSVVLNWRTETEVNNYGFEIEKAVNPVNNQKNWVNIGFVEGHGNSNSPKEYSFVDDNLNGGTVLYYRLKQIDNDGTYEYSQEVEINIASPNGFTLEQNYPNPFNPSTKIRYKLAEGTNVSLIVYNVLGQEVVKLVDGFQSAGSYSIVFYADELPGGIYFYTLTTDKYSKTNKMMLVK